ncbi:unnamed protein product [Discula destructiva]
MASNSSTARAGQNGQYFDSTANARRTPDLAASGPTASSTTPSRAQPATPASSRPNFSGSNNSRQQSSIGLRRLRPQPSVANDFAQPSQRSQANTQAQDRAQGRRRSTSEPQRPALASDASEGHTLKPLPSVPELSASGAAANKAGSVSGSERRRGWLSRFNSKSPAPQLTKQEQEILARDAEYDHKIVDLLDVVDPEVSTLTSITNVQNSLFLPNLGRFVNRRPTYDLSWAAPERRQSTAAGAGHESLENINEEPAQPDESSDDRRPSAGRAYSITSNVDSTHYAALPHGTTLEGWSPEDVERLEDHVRHMLHSRRSKIARGFKGFIRYASRPLGFLVTLYATLITLFGLAWVLFLIGWIEVGSKQSYLVEIIDYTLVALFAIVGDGLAPFRAVDTYHMIFIAHYHRVSWKLRRKLLLPKLRDHNDLPTEAVLPEVDLESARDAPSLASLAPGEEFSVLSPQQHEKLMHHQAKYAKSHTFYRPHETDTHFAFPIKLMVLITVLLDMHSCLQISLGSCTWGIPAAKRPFALTTVILCCSITCNASAGLVIWIGDRRTRKKDVIERMTRQELTEEAIDKVKREKEAEAEREAAEKEDALNGGGGGGGRKSASLPRLSLDKLTGGGGGGSRKGEGSAHKDAHKDKDTLKEEPELFAP